MQEYVINFFIWYYWVKVRVYLQLEIIGRFIYLLNWTRALPMAENLLTPMFQDKSISGRFIGFFIRFWWMTFGLLASILLIVPNIIIGGILIVLPFLPSIILSKLLMQRTLI